MVYRWKVPIYKISAQEAGEHIQDLIEKHGMVTPEILLEDARQNESVLHSCYEWNNSKAAEKYRLYQSKQIISNLIVLSVDENAETEKPVNAFITVNERCEKASYISTIKALSDIETQKQVIKNAKAELEMFKRKYQNLIDIKELIKECFTD